MKKNIYLSIIVPAYNEGAHIISTIEEIFQYLRAKLFPFEVIVIDDGSTDKTAEKVLKYKVNSRGLTLIKSFPNRGKGYVVRKAMLSAKGKYLLFMDADNSTSINELDNFLPYLQKGYDAVIGSRRLKESRITCPESKTRIIMGDVYILLSKILLGIKGSDFNCGFKAYNGSSAKKLFSAQKMDDWSFDTELIFLLNKYNMKTKEVPVNWSHKYDSKVSPARDAVRSFLGLLKIKLNNLRGRYNLE